MSLGPICLYFIGLLFIHCVISCGQSQPHKPAPTPDVEVLESERGNMDIEANDKLNGQPTTEQIKSSMAILNHFRGAAQRCGKSLLPKAETVYWSPLLYTAAKLHSIDMAETGRLSHQGSDGTTPFERITSTGYKYIAAAENVAGQLQDRQTAFDGWQISPGHCRNMMNNFFKQAALAESDGYWTLILATER